MDRKVSQSPELDKLLAAICSEGGELSGIGLADYPIVKEAKALGLIDVTVGDAWGLDDTVSLTPRQRVAMGLPPIVRKPSVLALAMQAVTAVVVRLFGKHSHM